MFFKSNSSLHAVTDKEKKKKKCWKKSLEEKRTSRIVVYITKTKTYRSNLTGLMAKKKKKLRKESKTLK